jgi:hypothetical protein
MKSVLLALPLTMLLAAPAMAGEVIFGAKTGPMMIDVNGIDDPVNTGIMVGYQQGVVLGDLGIEGEFTTTTSDGKISSTGDKVSVDTMAVYAALRTAGPLYFKVKGGYLQADFNQKLGSGSKSQGGASYGAGLGFGIGILQLELEYTQTSLDENLAFVSLGIQF